MTDRTPIRTLYALVDAVQEHIDSTGKHVYAEDLQATLDRVDDPELGRCINCGGPFEMRCSYGPPGGTEVGPFCETCYATIKAHEEPYERRHPAVPLAALRALIETMRVHDDAGEVGDDTHYWRAQLAALCDAVELKP